MEILGDIISPIDDMEWEEEWLSSGMSVYDPATGMIGKAR